MASLDTHTHILEKEEEEEEKEGPVWGSFFKYVSGLGVYIQKKERKKERGEKSVAQQPAMAA